MSRKKCVFLSSFNLFLRVLVAAIFCAAVLPTPALAADNVAIAGHISDNATGNPIPDGTVYIFTSGSPSPLAYIDTDANGDYSLSLPPGSGYEVEARAAGFVTQRAIDLTVSANTTTTVDFSLIPGGTISGAVSHFSMYTVMEKTGVARFEIKSLRDDPFEVDPCEIVTVTAGVTNTGDLAGDYLVTFSVDGETAGTTEISLDGHATRAHLLCRHTGGHRRDRYRLLA